MDFSKTVLIEFNYVCGNSRNEIFVKELAFGHIGMMCTQYYHFQEPYPIQQLTNDVALRCNKFVEKQYGTRWNKAGLPYTELSNVFNYIKTNAEKIVVKGAVKQRFIKQYFPDFPILNLEEVFDNMPCLRDLENFKFICDKHKSDELCPINNLCNMILYIQKKITNINE